VFSRWISWALHVSREDGTVMTALTSTTRQMVGHVEIFPEKNRPSLN